MATDYAQGKWPFGVSEVCTASNISFEEILMTLNFWNLSKTELY